MRVYGIAVLIGIGLVGCAYKAPVHSVSSPASEVRLDRMIDADASIYIEPELADLSLSVVPDSYVCSAHTYPVEIGSALKGSIIRVIDSAFESVDVRGSARGDVGDAFDVRFYLDTFRPSISFSEGFWSAQGYASTEIVLRVMVSRYGEELISRTIVAGEGSFSGSAGSSCGGGAQLLGRASEKALKRVMENFVYKVINSGDLGVSTSVRREETKQRDEPTLNLPTGFKIETNSN